jgi:DNA-binding HxlR family transcriptional regulator
MTRYGQFCAVARAMELLGERWTLLVVRELLMGATTFTEISRGLPRIPRATLSARLASLTRAGIVDTASRRYQLTESGLALSSVVRELARWATVTDAAPLRPEDLDAAALTWDIQRRVNRARLPDRLVVLEFDFHDRPTADRRYWLHLSRNRVDLCRQDTGDPIDVWIAAPLAPVTNWWLGTISWSDLLRRDDVGVQGDRMLQRHMDQWFLRYTFTPEALGVTEG